jgi:transposase
MDNILFNFWLANFLLPEIGRGKTIILDNAAFHKSQQTESIINDAGCNLIFLPAYSPDFNPIEKFWANLKKTIKCNINKFQTLQGAIDHAFQGIV